MKILNYDIAYNVLILLTHIIYYKKGTKNVNYHVFFRVNALKKFGFLAFLKNNAEISGTFLCFFFILIFTIYLLF